MMVMMVVMRVVVIMKNNISYLSEFYSLMGSKPVIMVVEVVVISINNII